MGRETESRDGGVSREVWGRMSKDTETSQEGYFKVALNFSVK